MMIISRGIQNRKTAFSGWDIQRKTAGFTYVEMVIVLSLLGIFAMLALPAVNSTVDEAHLSGAAQEIVNALQFAQLTAMTSGRGTQVVVEAEIDRISVSQFQINADLFHGGDILMAQDVENGAFVLMENPTNKGTDYKIDFPGESRFREVDIAASDFNATNPLTFDTLGHPSHAGTIVIAFNDRQMVVALDALSGRVAVSN